MIFKSCAWPIMMKEENGTILGEVRPTSESFERKLANAVLFCCPCVFRCRKSVGVGRDNNGDDDSTIITTTTPVIALRLNRNNDTVYVEHRDARIEFRGDEREICIARCIIDV